VPEWEGQGDTMENTQTEFGSSLRRLMSENLTRSSAAENFPINQTLGEAVSKDEPDPAFVLKCADEGLIRSEQ